MRLHSTTHDAEGSTVPHGFPDAHMSTANAQFFEPKSKRVGSPIPELVHFHSVAQVSPPTK